MSKLNLFKLIVLWFVLGCTALAASFDCEKAQAPVEKLICTDAELSNLDEEMSTGYREAQSHARNASALKNAQQLWLKARNLCPDAACVQDVYVKRLSALRADASIDAAKSTPPPLQHVVPGSGKLVVPPPHPRDPNMPCLSFDECRHNPVRTETLGANWQYRRDADKLPVIRNALASGNLKPQTDLKDAAFCSTFKEDFLSGRNVQVIEPSYEWLSVEDPRLGRWMDAIWNCPGSDDVDPTVKFLSLGLYGVPPYRFYRLELDGNKKNGPEELVLYRESGNGYGQRYDWVDLKQCVIRRAHQVMSPQGILASDRDRRDALGLLISYRGKLMVLSYADWAKQGESETNGSRVRLAAFLETVFCHWNEPLRPSEN